MKVCSTLLQTTLGDFEIAGSGLGVSRVHWLKEAAARPPVADLPADHPVAAARQQLLEYFEGRRKTFDFTIDWGGATEFHRRVWEELLKIPYGATRTYSDIARDIGNDKAVRAVGMANRQNPIAVAVPCHRVIGKAGELRGYFYGLDAKMELLKLESPHRYAEQTSLNLDF